MQCALLRPQLLVIAGMAWRHHSATAQPVVKDSAARDGPSAATAGGSIRGKTGPPQVYTYSIEREVDHSPEAFTQVLVSLCAWNRCFRHSCRA